MKGAPQDEVRFEQLFRATRRDLLAYLLRRTGSREDAADLLAETYLIAWRRLDAIPAEGQARLWLFGVARNLLSKGAGHRHLQHNLIERLASELRSTDESPVDDEPSEPLRSALKALPSQQLEVMLLTAWEGLTPGEIAAVTRTPVNLVRVRLHRARARLARDLGSQNSVSGRPARWSSAYDAQPPSQRSHPPDLSQAH